ncbi:hypothetical protein [Kribbella ginsengisoli]|uniref:Mycofactocin n=1 Tax=Kribbella ginsengisoli TaxID=363865 RepID=A0ABP6Z3A1_9ACTN
MPENRKQRLVELDAPIAAGCVDGVCEIPGSAVVPDSGDESEDDETSS